VPAGIAYSIEPAEPRGSAVLFKANVPRDIHACIF